MTVSYRRTVIGQLQLDCDDPVTECLLVCGPPPIAPDWEGMLLWRLNVVRWLHDRHGWGAAWKREAAATYLRQEILALVQKEGTSDGFA